MRVWILKFTGFVLWSMFLFAPFIAQADEGFDTFLPHGMQESQKEPDGILAFLGDIDVSLDDRGVSNGGLENKWALKLKAGKDTVITKSHSAAIQHDRIPLDDGGREALRFGAGLNYSF